MAELIKWWLLFELIGLIVFPICYYLFNNLYSKGYAFSKIIGLLLWGYLYWIGNIFEIIDNSKLGAIFTLVIVVGVSFFFTRKKISITQITQWARDHFSLILFFEGLFLVAVLFMAVLRSASPEIIGTEKPMELTFINGILRTPTFPPNDPWLSGYPISYYYFGYLIIAVIVKVIGTGSSIAFNCALIFWFGLIAAGASEIVMDLLLGKGSNIERHISKSRLRLAMVYSLLGPLFMLILSNGEGLLELLHSLGVFWKSNPNGLAFSQFWKWIDIKELTMPPPIPYDWDIHRAGGTWWWRASRVLQDYT
ncbi:MAG: hypothetical protein J7L66_04265, partial [Anaerolineaceae bacterium]|nr:hypothetical protein [Anaerolineaceae bacterium]